MFKFSEDFLNFYLITKFSGSGQPKENILIEAKSVFLLKIESLIYENPKPLEFGSQPGKIRKV